MTSRYFFYQYELPLDTFPLKYTEGKRDLTIQLGVLSTSEVGSLLKVNPNTAHVVFRAKNGEIPMRRDIKGYCSFFFNWIMQFTDLIGRKNSHSNVVLSYP